MIYSRHVTEEVSMHNFWRVFYAVLAVIAAVALAAIAYNLTSGVIERVQGPSPARIDYTNMVVILLTTVTVIFSVCALALAVLAVVSFRGLKREAGKFASQQAASAITNAFNEGGKAHTQIQEEFTRYDGHLKKWAERRIRQEVIELLPLVADRLGGTKASSALDEDAPTDEGQVE
jgi:hypothetical protein